MTIIHDVRLPEYIEQGSTGGPQFFTSILRLASGQESRNQNWQDAKCVYDITYGVTNNADDGSYADVLSFFRARRGRLYGFRFKDWSDFQGFGQPVVATGIPGQYTITKVYNDAVSSFTRKITRIVDHTLAIYVDGVLQPGPYGSAFSNGVLNYPGPTGVITVDYEFDVPVRFDSDTLSLQVYQDVTAEVASITLTEVIE